MAFKSYRSDGAQMIDEETEAIKSRIRDAVQGIEILSTAESFEDLVNDGAIHILAGKSTIATMR